MAQQAGRQAGSTAQQLASQPASRNKLSSTLALWLGWEAAGTRHETGMFAAPFQLLTDLTC